MEIKNGGIAERKENNRAGEIRDLDLLDPPLTQLRTSSSRSFSLSPSPLFDGRKLSQYLILGAF